MANILAKFKGLLTSQETLDVFRDQLKVSMDSVLPMINSFTDVVTDELRDSSEVTSHSINGSTVPYWNSNENEAVEAFNQIKTKLLHEGGVSNFTLSSGDVITLKYDGDHDRILNVVSTSDSIDDLPFLTLVNSRVTMTTSLQTRINDYVLSGSLTDDDYLRFVDFVYSKPSHTWEPSLSGGELANAFWATDYMIMAVPEEEHEGDIRILYMDDESEWHIDDVDYFNDFLIQYARTLIHTVDLSDLTADLVQSFSVNEVLETALNVIDQGQIATADFLTALRAKFSSLKGDAKATYDSLVNAITTGGVPGVIGVLKELYSSTLSASPVVDDYSYSVSFDTNDYTTKAWTVGLTFGAAIEAVTQLASAIVAFINPAVGMAINLIGNVGSRVINYIQDNTHILTPEINYDADDFSYAPSLFQLTYNYDYSDDGWFLDLVSDPKFLKIKFPGVVLFAWNDTVNETICIEGHYDLGFKTTPFSATGVTKHLVTDYTTQAIGDFNFATNVLNYYSINDLMDFVYSGDNYSPMSSFSTLDYRTRILYARHWFVWYSSIINATEVEGTYDKMRIASFKQVPSADLTPEQQDYWFGGPLHISPSANLDWDVMSNQLVQGCINDSLNAVWKVGCRGETGGSHTEVLYFTIDQDFILKCITGSTVVPGIFVDNDSVCSNGYFLSTIRTRSKYYVIPPRYTVSSFIIASLCTAFIVAAVTVATLAISTKVKHRLTEKMSGKYAEIANINDELKQDPNNRDLQVKQRKAIRRYNIRAKIFGYSTLNPIDGWQTGDNVASSVNSLPVKGAVDDLTTANISNEEWTVASKSLDSLHNLIAG